MRRAALNSCSAIALVAVLFVSTPARAGIADWWDVFAGMHEIEIKRFNRQADATLAWHQAQRVRAVRDTLALSLRRLKPPQIEALEAALDDQTRWNDAKGRALDRLRLPAADGNRQLSAGETRELLGLPPEGLGFEGIAVLRCNNRMVVYHDIDARELLRFFDDAELLFNTLHQNISKNPPVPRDTMSVDNQLGEYMPLLIANGQMKRHYGVTMPVPACMAHAMPQTPTIGLFSTKTPHKTNENVRIGDCPDGQVGGVFRKRYFVNGAFSRDGETWDTCVPKPPLAASVSTTEREDGCGERPGMTDFLARLIGRYSDAYGFETSGNFARSRKHWTHTETFPPEWRLSPLVLTWTDDWIVHQDTCQANWKTPGSPDRGTRTVTRGGLRCTQHRRRDTVRNWLQYPGGGVQQSYPFVTRPYGWRNVGQPVCPVRSRTVSVERRTIAAGICQQEQRREVTTHWLTYADGRRTQDNPHVTHGAWQDVGNPDCPPPPSPPRVASSNSGGDNDRNYGDGEASTTSFDTDGDGITDSSSSSGGHYGYSDSGLGSEASGGWSGGSFGTGNWGGSSDLGGGGWSGDFGAVSSSGRGASSSSGGGRSGGSSGGGGGGEGGSGGGGGGGWCFLTTQVVVLRGEADNGPTLTKLRRFRDTFMANDPAMRREVGDYYRLAPKIIAANPPDDPVWTWIGDRIDAAIAAIDAGNNREAYEIYKAMVTKLATDLPA